MQRARGVCEAGAVAQFCWVVQLAGSGAVVHRYGTAVVQRSGPSKVHRCSRGGTVQQGSAAISDNRTGVARGRGAPCLAA